MISDLFGWRLTVGGHFTPLLLIGLVIVAGGSQRQTATQRRDSDTSLARSYVSSARKALAEGNTASAQELLERAIKVNARYPEAYFLLGLTEFKAGETGKAIHHYKRALELEPRSYSGHYNLALAYLRENRTQDARLELEKAVHLDAKQADAAYDLGIVLLELQDPSAALVHLRRARALDPGRPDAVFNIIRAQVELGRVAEARTEARAAANRFASDFQWNASIGQLFSKHAQPNDAVVYLRHASRLRPANTDIRHHLAVACLESREPEEVLNAIRKPKTAEDYYLRASAHYMSHRFHEADQESAEALTIAPDNPQILVLRTRLLQRAGEQTAALATAQKVITLAPNWDEPYYLAGVSYYFLRRYAEAEQSLSRASELNPVSARALFLHSIASSSLGNQRSAEASLRRAISLQPRNARFYCHLGILMARLNQQGKAEELFKTATRLRPDYALPHYELGKLLANARRFSEAAQELSQSVTYDPGLSSAYYQLGRVYAQLGQAEKSEHFFAEFKKTSNQPMNDSVALDDDARKETEP